MSRAFVKEPEGDQTEDILEKPQSEHPNYITLPGLEHMKQELHKLLQQKNELKEQEDNLNIKNQLRTIETESRYLEKRIQCAIPVDITSQSSEAIRFGATVKLIDGENNQYSFTIVGEDEADVDSGKISWVSPLARELIGKKTDDIVNWQRPAGDLEVEILNFYF